MEGNSITEEQQKDIDTRVLAFNSAFKELCEKKEVDVISYPQWVPTMNGTFITQSVQVVVDRKYRPIASPIQKESIIKK